MSDLLEDTIEWIGLALLDNSIQDNILEQYALGLRRSRACEKALIIKCEEVFMTQPVLHTLLESHARSWHSNGIQVIHTGQPPVTDEQLDSVEKTIQLGDVALETYWKL